MELLNDTRRRNLLYSSRGCLYDVTQNRNQCIHCSGPINQVSHLVTFLFLIIWLDGLAFFETINRYYHVKTYVSGVNHKPIETNENSSNPFIQVSLLYYDFIYECPHCSSAKSHVWPHFHDGTNYFSFSSM